jgi:DNA-binding MarR family transcriptional regulator
MGTDTLSGAIPRMVLLLEEVQRLDKEMPAQTLMAFLLVASAGPDGIVQNELQQKLGLSGAAVSRNVTFLSKARGVGLPGHGLVESEIDEVNRRHRRLTLTPKGERLAEKLSKIIDG